MKIFGIEFAPLSIPFERRIQTFAVLHFTTTFLFFGFGCLFGMLYLILFTNYWWFPLVYYFLWYIRDSKTPERGGRRLNCVRNWGIWRYMADYFPMKLIKTEEIDPMKNYLFCYHPHGVLSCGAFVHFATEGSHFSKIFPGIKPYLLVLLGHFQFPLYREYFLSSGSAAATKDSIMWILTKEGPGNAAVLVVGGAKESLDAHPGKYTLRIKERKGFVKLALQSGASLVPVFSFGENDLFVQVKNPDGSFIRWLQNRLTRFLGFAPPLFHGRGIFNYSMGLLPFRKPVSTVVGKPLDLPKLEDPTREEVQLWHDRYVAALCDMFESHKVDCGVAEDQYLTITA